MTVLVETEEYTIEIINECNKEGLWKCPVCEEFKMTRRRHKMCPSCRGKKAGSSLKHRE